ncbi:MAG: hypothetical protein Q9178_006559 [Gyalolechia marmorata]
MEVLHAAPTKGQFTPLSTHESQTPSSFHSGPPVLHYLSPSTTISINSQDLESAPAFQNLVSPQQRSNGSVNSATEDEPEGIGHEITIEGVDVWVTSEYRSPINPSFLKKALANRPVSKFMLYSPTLSTGISIPYPSISLHAIQRSSTPSLLLQVLSSSGPQFDDHDPEGTISLTIIPCNTTSVEYGSPPPTPITPRPTQTVEEVMSRTDPSTNTVDMLFSALSACADLHPDHASNSDFDVEGAPNEGSEAAYTQIDGLPPPIPGSGGWITAENVAEFFDEEGNPWAGPGLGDGAGRVREREEEEGAGGADGDGIERDEGESEGNKWRRTG